MLISVFLAVFILISILTALLLLIVSTPVKIEGCFSFPESKPIQARLSLIGGVTPWIKLSSGSPNRSKKPKGRQRHPIEKKSPSARTRRMIIAGPELIISVLKKIRLDAGRIELDFGFDDPAVTGELFGRLAPVSYSGLGSESCIFLIRPDFNQTRFNVKANVSLRFAPLRLVPPALAFAWKVWGPKA